MAFTPNIQYQPVVAPAPLVAPNLAATTAPMTAEFTKAFASAQDFGRMNPDVVRQALQDGGGLSRVLGFNSPTQVAGLTPQELLALTQGQGSAQSLNQAGQNFDMITGGKESRDAQRTLAERLFSSNMQTSRDQAQLDSSTAVGNRSADVAIQTTNAGNKLHADTSIATLQEAELRDRETARHNKAAEVLGQKGLDLKARELKYYQTMNQPGVAATGLPLDPKLQDNYREMATYWNGVNKENSDDNAQVNATQYEIMAMSLGKPWGTTYQIGEKSSAKFGGATAVLMRPEGYFGIKQNKEGKWNYTSNSPVMNLPGAGVASGKATSVGPKYSKE